MRLGKDVLEADLYGELGLLPDATASEIRVAYRHKVRASHPDLNQADPDAVPRMTRLNVAAKVLLDPATRRLYDRASRGAPKPSSQRPPRQAAWFDRRAPHADSEWAAPPPEPRAPAAVSASFFSGLRGREGHFSLQVQELVESLSVRQQVSVAALLFALALGLIVMSRPQTLVSDSSQPATVDLGVYP